MLLEIDSLKTSSLKVKQLFLDPFGEHLLITCGNINSSQLFYTTKQLSKLKPVSNGIDTVIFYLYLTNKFIFLQFEQFFLIGRQISGFRNNVCSLEL